VSDVNVDIVFIEQARSVASSFVEGDVDTGERTMIDGLGQALTYDDLVDKIFSSEHVVVL
jgi:hypothetical protein